MSQRQYQHVVTEPEKKGRYQKMIAETLKGFKGGDLFKAFEKTYKAKASDGEPLPPNKKEMVTTVPEKLAYTEVAVIELLDYEITRDRTNQKASADLVVNGVVLAKAVPVITLIGMEKRLKEIRNYYDSIPTLDLSQKWEPAKGYKDRFQVGPFITYRSEKKAEGVILAAATDKHQAQVKEVVREVQIGEYSETQQSGELHPGEKSELLGRIDSLIEAVKQSRMKANEAEVEQSKIGKSIFDFIHKRK